MYTLKVVNHVSNSTYIEEFPSVTVYPKDSKSLEEYLAIEKGEWLRSRIADIDKDLDHAMEDSLNEVKAVIVCTHDPDKACMIYENQTAYIVNSYGATVMTVRG